MYRHQTKSALLYHNQLLRSFEVQDLPRLHWLDNFAKSYAANDMYIHRDLLHNRYWTAHGYKAVPAQHNLLWSNDADGNPLPAMPLLHVLFSNEGHEQLLTDLTVFSRLFYQESVAVTRDVRRVPLKVTLPRDEKEEKHLSLSSDGLRFFYPVDIYADNITSTKGLLRALQHVQENEGFGDEKHARLEIFIIACNVSQFW